jgi:hypothetical protein
MNKFSDFAEPGHLVLAGKKVGINSVLDKEIIVTGFRVKPSKYKDKCEHCVTVQFCHAEDGEKFVFFTGSDVLHSQLAKAKELGMFPFQATLQKPGNHYTFS